MKTFISLCTILTLFCACKTRKVATQTSSVSQSSTVAVNKTTTDSLHTQSVDTSKSTKSSTTEAKTGSSRDATLEVDSIVQTKNSQGTKTVIYPTKGKVIHYQVSDSSNVKTNGNVSRQSGVTTFTTGVLTTKTDSNTTVKKDSTGKTKNSSAIGSGTTYAKWIGISILVFVVLIVVVIYLRSKKPKV
jgi:hypothetical protein